MINGWEVESTLTKKVEGYLLELDAEPALAEVGEKVRELTADLHQKILSQELQWSLMMTPLYMIEDLAHMCESEIERRKEEAEVIYGKRKEDENKATESGTVESKADIRE